MTRISPESAWSGAALQADESAEFEPDEVADPEEPDSLAEDGDLPGSLADPGEANPVDVAEQRITVAVGEEDYGYGE